MSLSGITLVVDDHIDLAENIAEILQSRGYATAIAGSAEAALEIIAAGRVTALITDFRLPRCSGADLIGNLRRRGIGIPAIVMSAYTDDTTIEAAEKAGAFDILAKPIDIARLISAMESLGT